MALSKVKLSGSTNGRNIEVVATSTLGTTIHAAHATAQDELYLWAVNNDTVERTLTIEFGGVTSTDDLIPITIPPKCGLVTVVPGIPLTGSVVVTAFASAANVINVSGFVNRIS